MDPRERSKPRAGELPSGRFGEGCRFGAPERSSRLKTKHSSHLCAQSETPAERTAGRGLAPLSLHTEEGQHADDHGETRRRGKVPDIAAMAAPDTLAALHVNPDTGLTHAEVEVCREEYGYNEVAQKGTRSSNSFGNSGESRRGCSN
jgi:hypothetical protein